MNIYVASSWRNPRQPDVVKALREDGHEVYDFRNPAPGDQGFKWSDIDPAWENWGPVEFCRALEHPTAEDRFAKDMGALDRADVVVLVMPCGRSSHLELGYGAGAGKHTAILLDESGEPELMYKMAAVFVDLEDMRDWLLDLRPMVCRVCGCTDNDCSQCVEKTGEPCHWVEPDLCSACAGVEGGG